MAEGGEVEEEEEEEEEKEEEEEEEEEEEAGTAALQASIGQFVDPEYQILQETHWVSGGHFSASGNCPNESCKDAVLAWSSSGLKDVPGVLSGKTTTCVTEGFPSVNVTVLSNRTAFMPCATSKGSPPFIRIPFDAATAVPTIIAVGVARPKAHGQLTTTTLIAKSNAKRVGSPYSSS